MNQSMRERGSAATFLSKDDIARLLPHQGRALCIDRATYGPTFPNIITTSVNLSGIHHYFEGHFPGNPILPAHWQIEMICLSAALLMKLRFPELKGLPVATSFGDSQKFSKPISPPQQIDIITVLTKQRNVRGSIFAYFDAKIYLTDGKLATTVKNLFGSLIPEN